jgi:hypothetical protein
VQILPRGLSFFWRISGELSEIALMGDNNPIIIPFTEVPVCNEDFTSER